MPTLRLNSAEKRVAELDRHDELLARGGKDARMWAATDTT